MARDYESRPRERYSSEPVRSQRHWPEGFYTGERHIDEDARRAGERPHGWGRFEANYDIASSEPRRIDAPSYRGIGPKGYRRSDARTREIICDQLMDDPRIDASDIDIEVQNDEVRLTGTVDSRRTKYLVEELVATATGSDNIVNLLRIAS